MPDDLSAIRARARAQQHQIDARTVFFTVYDLAARWGCSPSTVRTIPRERLPYTVIGVGAKREHRRYDPALVQAYERQREGAA